MQQPEVVKSKTIFHAEGLWTPTWHFDRLHFFPKAYLEKKTTKSRMLQSQGQCKGTIKVIEVKDQGHFAIVLVRKV